MAKPNVKSAIDFLNDLPGDDVQRVAADYPQYSLHDIEPDPDQVRKQFDAERDTNLRASVEKFGVMQPILIHATGGTPPYRIVAGERRWRAAKAAGLMQIPAREVDSTERLIIQIVENTQRQDCTDYDLALALQTYMERDKKVKQKDLAALIDRSPSHITRLFAMLDPQWAALISEKIIVSAPLLERFKALSEDDREKLVDHAKEQGRPLSRVDFDILKPAPSTSDTNNAQSGVGEQEKASTAPTSKEKKDSKTVSVKLAVEAIERLIPHFVDKEADKVDIKVSADLAIALIENLGGSVPDDPKEFGAKIKELLS